MISLTRKILDKGHIITLASGRLIIRPSSGKPIPSGWMSTHEAKIKQEILCALGMDAYEYIGYSTGHYGPHKAAGVTLQFVSLTTEEEAYAVYNVRLTRTRTTTAGAKGTPLPARHFRVGRRHEFYKFWLRSGVTLPPRAAKFHDYMGNLRDIIFAAPLRDNRLDKQQLKPLTLTHEEIFAAFMSPNVSTTPAQSTHICRTAVPHNTLPEKYAVQGLQQIEDTGAAMYGNKVISMSSYKSSNIPPVRAQEEQSVEDWLKDYNARSPMES